MTTSRRNQSMETDVNELERAHNEGHINIAEFVTSRNEKPETAAKIIRELQDGCKFCQINLIFASNGAGFSPLKLLEKFIKMSKLDFGIRGHLTKEELSAIATGKPFKDLLPGDIVGLIAHAIGCPDCYEVLDVSIVSGERSISQNADKAMENALLRLQRNTRSKLDMAKK